MDAGEQVAGEHQVVVAQGKNIRLVGAIWCGGQAKQEARRKVVEQAVIGRRGGMVEFVDHHVIEVLRREAFEMGDASQGLHRSAQHIHLAIALLAPIKTNPRGRPNAQEGFRRLIEDLLAMSDEQHPPRPELLGIEGGQPGLAQAGGKHHQAAAVALGTTS
ncbi:hypothetical protein D3C80_1312090 [compost metagenome]